MASRYSNWTTAQLIEELERYDNNIFRALIRVGHSFKRAEEIMDEARRSSDPYYVLNYFGIK